MKPNSYFFHDYETFGLNTKKTRVSQFAGIRTDADLNIIESECFDYFSLPPIDFLPSPEACIVTGLTPYSIENNEKKYLNDFELFQNIFSHFNQSGTCSLGYNTIGFDDEITRNGFYRNFFPIYDREFKSNCSRYDILNLVREFAFLYPDEIKIPLDEEGNQIFKLDTLAPLNGFDDGKYHDAFTDVKATIFIAKLIKDAHPEYWDFRINLHKKRDMADYLNNNKKSILLYTHSTNGGKTNFVEPVLITSYAYPDGNSFVGIKLSNLDGIKEILNADSSKLKERLYMTNDELEEEELTRLPFVKIASNKAPIIISLNDAIKFNVFKINKPLDEINKNLEFALQHYDELRNQSMQAYKKEDFINKNKNSDLLIYGGFMSRNDEAKAMEFRIDIKKRNFSKYILNDLFEEPKLNDLARKLIFRNFSDEVVKDKDLRPHYHSFLKQSYHMIKKSGFLSKIDYTDEELNDTNFKTNDKMVEFTLSELVNELPILEDKHKEDPEKLNILQDFRKSLNSLVALYKEKDQLINNLNDEENNKKVDNKPSTISKLKLR